MTISAFSDELAQVRTKKKEFLSQIERIVPWGEWLAMIQPCYYKGERGNKPYPLEIMLRLYLLQNLYDLSDEATVAEAIDSRAFSEFCSVDSSNQVPDGDTLGRFRNLLIRNGLQEKLFAYSLAWDTRRKIRWRSCKFRKPASGTRTRQKPGWCRETPPEMLSFS